MDPENEELKDEQSVEQHEAVEEEANQDQVDSTEDSAGLDDSHEETSEQSDHWKKKAKTWEKRAKANQAKAVDAEAALERERAARMRSEAIFEIAEREGISPRLLSRMNGETEEEIEENARMLKSSLSATQSYPSVRDSGYSGKDALTKEEILNTKNRSERLELIRQNPDLFN